MEYDKLIEAIEFFKLDKKVSIKNLKKKYHKLAKELHPDKGGEVEIMKKVNEYYKILLEYLESYEIPIDENSIISSSPSAFMYFQYYKKQSKDGRIGF
ncbi:MAG: DnaJ domain-containing protein [Brevinematia bacterium]